VCLSKDRAFVLCGWRVPILRCERLVPGNKKMKNILRKSFKTIALPIVFLALSLTENSFGQIISQYIETNSGSVPKGIEIWNNTGSTIVFSSANPLTVQQGTNGAAATTVVTITTGSLSAGRVMVIGTSDLGTYLTAQGLTSVPFTTFAFAFNGDDALVVKLNGVTTDIFGQVGTDPGTNWGSAAGVSTMDQNIQLKSGITSGAAVNWTDPSLRFEKATTILPASAGGLAGFGVAPSPGSSATIPGAPTSLSIASGDQSLVISFTAPTDGGAPITNYKYSIDGFNFIALSPAKTTSPITITGLSNGTSYNVQIKAVNSVGDSLASAVATGTPALPAVSPVVTAATISGTFGLALSATVVASENPTSYAVTSGTLPAGLSLDPTTGAITGTPTAAGTGVVVAVTASNATGTSAPANLTFDIAKGGQTISGLSTADSKYTTAPSYPLTATASSGLAVTYTSSDEAVAIISDSTVTIVGAGTTTITASQAGDNNYNAATNVTQSLTVSVPPMVAWEMTGVSNGGSSPMAPTTVDNRVVVEGLTKGSGIGAVATGNVWGGNNFMGTDLTTAITNNDFATFSVTPASGYQVSFSQIPAYNIRRSSTGPATCIWQYQKGSGAFTDIGSAITNPTDAASGNTKPAISLSDIADLQNVPAGTTVTFRLIAWGGAATGTFYINNITGNDLAVLGTISEYTALVPSLSSFTPAFGPSGSTVTISGSDLSIVTGVKFNGQSATFAYQASDGTIAATVPAGLRAGKISLVYGSPEAEVLSNTNFEPLDGSGLATVVNGDGSSPYVNTAIFAKGQSDNQTLAVTVSNPIVNSAISTVRITLPSDFPVPNSPSFSLNGAPGTVSVSGSALTVEGADVTSESPLTVTISGLSTPDTSVSTALDGNYGITVETAGAGGTLANVLVAPTAYVLVPIINLRGVDVDGVPTQLGKKVAFEGVVTASGLGSTAGRTKAYVQDASAAVYIYSTAFSSAPIQGNIYAALGTLTQFRGGTQIDPGISANLIDRGAGVLPEPTVLTLPISTTVGERYEGSLVKVVGLSRAAGETDLWATSATITLQDSAAATVDLFLQPGSTATTEPATYPATVVGILGQYAQVSPFTTGYQLQPFNSAPTDITLSPVTIAENNAVSEQVGAFSTTDSDVGNAFAYTLVEGTGETDNASFNIINGNLVATTVFDYETKNSYSVRVRSTDQGGLYFEKQFTITVTDVNETPADTTPPVITLIGDNPQLIANGAVYADLGASVTDNVDATRTVTGTGTVDTAIAGDYTVTYNATDAANNAATQVTRTVRVAGTYADWSGGSTLDSAGLAKYAIGGASSLTANDGVKPTTTLTGEFLVITAIVRTDNSRLAVVGQAVTDLANYASGTGVTTVNGVETTDQEGVPTGHKRKTFSVARDGDARKFMRLSASLALSGTNTTVSVARDSGGATFLQVTGATAGSTSGGTATSDKRTIYYYAPDTTSSPTFSGPAWPYVMVQGQLSAGAGVTATLTKNSSGMLLVNGLPAYQYVGDSGSTTATGVDGAWPAMRSDGTKTTTAPGGTLQ